MGGVGAHAPSKTLLRYTTGKKGGRVKFFGTWEFDFDFLEGVCDSLKKKKNLDCAHLAPLFIVLKIFGDTF